MLQKLTKEIVVAKLLPDATQMGFQQSLNACKAQVITKQTIKVNYEVFKKLRDIHAFFEEKRKVEDKPDRDNLKARKAGYDEYLDQIEDILNAADPLFAKFNEELLIEEKEFFAEIARKNEITGRHMEFVNDTVKQVTGAVTTEELVRIQKLIGSEKSKTAFYGDYHPIMKGVCDSLLSLIDGRKKILKDNKKLQADFEKADAAGDTVLATRLREEMDDNERFVSQNAIILADEAYKQVSEISKITSELESAAITPRLHRWSWRVDDIELLYKKMPEFVVKEPNSKEINSFSKRMQDAGELKESGDNNFNGLVIFRKPYYVAFPKSKSDAS